MGAFPAQLDVYRKTWKAWLVISQVVNVSIAIAKRGRMRQSEGNWFIAYATKKSCNMYTSDAWWQDCKYYFIINRTFPAEAGICHSVLIILLNLHISNGKILSKEVPCQGKNPLFIARVIQRQQWPAQMILPKQESMGQIESEIKCLSENNVNN